MKGDKTIRRWIGRTVAAAVAVAGVGLFGAGPAFAADLITVTSVYSDNTITDHLEGVIYGPTWGAGMPLATFTDSGACSVSGDPTSCQAATDYHARILWGDSATTLCPAADCTIAFASVSGNTGTYNISASHAFLDEKNTTAVPSLGFTVHVVVNDVADVATGKGDNSASSGISVKDQPMGPAAAPFSFAPTTGVAFSGQIGSFVDANELAVTTDQGAAAVPEFAISINWGDGTIDTTSGTFTIGTCGTDPGLGAGQGCQVNVNGSHTYTSSGTKAVTITVKDGLTPTTEIINSTANVGGNTGNSCTTATTTLVPSTATLATGGSQLFTASSTNCPNPMFQFWLQYPAGTGPWVVVQPFSTANTWTWNAGVAPYNKPGAYKFVVWANQTGHSQSTFEAYGTASATLTGCGSVGALFSPLSPQPSGTNPVTLTGSTSGCAMPQFEFWMLAPGASSWVDVQPYSASAVLSWNTLGSVAGTYNFSVWAKDANSGGAAGNSLGRWDNYKAATYTLTSVTCTSMSVTTTPTGTAPAGTNPVVIKGFAAPCSFPEYQFWILAPGSSSWMKVQAYGASATYNWNTTGAAKGVYHISVWLKDSGSAGKYSNSLGRYDVAETITYTLT